MTVHHIVLFKWTHEPDAEFLRRLSEGFDGFVGGIPGVRSIVHGPGLRLDPTSFDHGLIVEFDSVASQREYRDHVVHRTFVDDVLSGWIAETASAQIRRASE